jgi:hypothetical protein
VTRLFAAAIIRMAAAWVATGIASTASAHGFGQRFDLPLPLWLWLTGAGTTILLTFAVFAFFVREKIVSADCPHLNLMRFAIFRAIAHPAIIELIRALAVVLFVLTVCAGVFGAQSPYTNLITTMVWVVWWVGFAFVCALFGDAWAVVNPLRTISTYAEALHGALTCTGARPPRVRYPPQLGVAPAIALFACFAWCELVWRNKDVPFDLATAVISYAAITFMGMLVYGRDVWLKNGEAFAVAFGVLARFAPLAVPPHREGAALAVNLRPPGAGLVISKPVHPSYMVFILLMLASVTFDGFRETPAMQKLETAAQSAPIVANFLFDLSELAIDETQLIHTIALIAFPLGFLAAFLMTCKAMAWLTRPSTSAILRHPTTSEAARAFVLTLVPIAVAYHLSHYLSLLLTAGQFIVPLASDPFGFGWNLFGTAKYKVDFAIASPYVVWYSAVTLIVIGHVIAVFLAHLEALRIFGNRRDAMRSQIPMMVLMVAYTTLSLWIFAQPIVG